MERQGPNMNTLQVFVTSLCDKTCAGCFYGTNLAPKSLPVIREDTGHMGLRAYCEYLDTYVPMLSARKVSLLGGEPLLHPQLKDILEANRSRGLRTTIYTNGTQLHRLTGWDLTNVTVRVGILGLHRGEKRLAEIPHVDYTIDICYMTRKQSVAELIPCMQYAEKHFKVGEFMISNIVDYEHTGKVWVDDHKVCLSKQEYIALEQYVIWEYRGSMTVTFSKRGALGEPGAITRCRFLNVLHDGRTCLCPFDIPLPQKHERDAVAEFGRECNKGPGGCFFQKHYM